MADKTIWFDPDEWPDAAGVLIHGGAARNAGVEICYAPVGDKDSGLARALAGKGFFLLFEDDGDVKSQINWYALPRLYVFARDDVGFYAADEPVDLNSAAPVFHVDHEGRVTRTADSLRALVEAMAAEARESGLAFLTLEVRAQNAAGRELYENCGFVEVGLRRGYYDNPPDDAILMTLYL